MMSGREGAGAETSCGAAPRPLIGIDLDNTIVGYDRLFRSIAIGEGLLPARFVGTKKELRDALRLMPDGEQTWTRLQAVAYGTRMAEAELIDGVATFLIRCRDAGLPVTIISHKTRFAAADPGGVDLREAALAWLQAQGFFDAGKLAVDPGRVFFEATRTEKCQRIASEGCTHFIDDLEEVLLDHSFPAQVRSYLFQPTGHAEHTGPYSVHTSWASITDDLLAAALA